MPHIEAKVSPDAIQDFESRTTSRVSSFTTDIIRKLRDDDASRSEWKTKRIEGWERRYGLLMRDPKLPWVGSSNVIVPTIDMAIESRKGSYLAVNRQSPIAIFEAVDPDSMENAATAEMHMDYRLKRKGSDWGRQSTLWSDNIITYGVGIIKTFWEFQTQDSMERVSRRRLPPRLAQLMLELEDFVRTGGTISKSQREAKKILNRGGQAAVMSEVRDLARRIIAAEYQLDPENQREAAEIAKLVSFLEGGEDTVLINKLDIVKNDPRAVSVHPFNCIVPPYTTSFEQTDRMVHIIRFHETAFQQSGWNKKWNRNAVNAVLKKLDDIRKNRTGMVTGSSFVSPLTDIITREMDEAFNDQSGIVTSAVSGLIDVWEIYTWFSEERGGRMGRYIITYQPDADVILKFRRLPHEHGRWPLIDIGHELNVDNYYSHRGMPEILDDLDLEATSTERHKINTMMMATAPMFAYRAGAPSIEQHLRFVPGAIVPLQRPDDLREIQVTNHFASLQQHENTLRALIEQRSGGIDFALSGPTAQAGDPRTAREISAVTMRSEQANNVPLMNYFDGLSEAFSQMWSMIEQYGPEGVLIRTGAADVMRKTKEDIQGRFDIRVNAPLGVSNPAFRMQMDIAFLQWLIQAKQVAGNDPRHEIDVPQFMLTMLEHIDVRRARSVIRLRNPEEQQQVAQLNMQDRQLEQMERMSKIQANLGAASGGVQQQGQVSGFQPSPAQGPSTELATVLGGGL